jgi:hypothetical protein
VAGCAIYNFNLKNENDQKKCFNFKNLQVLSKHDNKVKNKNVSEANAT